MEGAQAVSPDRAAAQALGRCVETFSDVEWNDRNRRLAIRNDRTKGLTDRYDREAGDYRDLWAPILRKAGLGLVRELAAGRAERVLDVGTGVGAHRRIRFSAFLGG